MRLAIFMQAQRETFPAVSPGFNAIKLSPSGTILWNKKFSNGSQHYDVSSCRLNTTTGRFVLTGTSLSSPQNVTTVTFNTSTGNTVWSSTVTAFGGRDVTYDASGSTYVLSHYPSPGTLDNDLVLLKYNTSGTLVWTRYYEYGNDEIARRMVYTPDNNLVLTGAGAVAGNVYLDWVTFKVNTGGTTLWKRRNNLHPSNTEIPYFIATDSQSGVYITGTGGPPPGGSSMSYQQMVTVKYSAAGAKEWTATNDSTTAIGVGIAVASDNSIFVAGLNLMTLVHYLNHTGTGTCTVPAGLSASNSTSSSVTLNWNTVSGVSLYHIQYKIASSSTWTTISTGPPPKILTGLFSGSSYNVRVEAVCTVGPSGYGAQANFITTGTSYCASQGLNATQEWITFVWLEGISRQSASDGGYVNVTNMSALLNKGATYTITLSAVPFSQSVYEHWRVWIDYNQDNDFTDAGEQEVAFSSNNYGWQLQSFGVPATALTGNTRMRVSFKKRKCGCSLRNFSLRRSGRLHGNDSVFPGTRSSPGAGHNNRNVYCLCLSESSIRSSECNFKGIFRTTEC